MGVKITYQRSFSDLIIKPDSIIKLATIIYEPWKRELESAEKKWKSDELPKTEKRIDKHNERIEKGEHSYFFNTTERIDEKTRKNIVNEQKEFFIHVSE